MIRVLITAPSAIIRAGLESLVRSSPALELVSSDPDVILADLEDPQEEGPPSELLATAAVVLLVSHPSGPWTIEALRSGVRAVLPRDVSASRDDCRDRSRRSRPDRSPPQ